MNTSPSPPKRFTLDGQKFFLTFPRNAKSKEDAMISLKELFRDNLEYAIVAQEDHKEDTEDTTIKHLHILFKTKERYRTTKGDCFDIIGDKHGNYEGIRSEQQAIQYIIKHGDFIEYNIDTSKYLKANTKKTATKPTKGIFKQITDNIDISTEYKDILLKYPDISLQHGRKIKEYIKDYKEAHRPSHRDWVMNVSYLYGKTGTGKSKEAYKDYHPDTHYILSRPQGGNIWFDGYSGQETIIIDDFSHSDYKLSYLLNLLDRYPMQLPVKGGFTPMIAKNIIITSNYSPHSIYKGVDNPEHREALFRRISTYIEYISKDTQNIYTEIQSIHQSDTIDTDTEDEEDIIEPIIQYKETKQISNQYRCHICQDTFRTEQYLRVHSRIHNRKHKEDNKEDITDTERRDFQKSLKGNILGDISDLSLKED